MNPPASSPPAATPWLTPSAAALLIANLVPLVGVVAFEWKVFPLVFVFWSENVVVGLFNVLKMITARAPGAGEFLAKFVTIPFFCVHYGMFTFVHGMFVITLFGGAVKQGAGFPSVETFFSVMHSNHLTWAIVALLASHGVSFFTNYIGRGEYRRATMQQLMHQPYGRIVVLHVAIIGGAFLMAALGSPVWGLALLVALKIALDLRSHRRERRRFAAQPAIDSRESPSPAGSR
jgi:hypothetical protein